MDETDARSRFEAAYDAHLGAVIAYARRRTDAGLAEEAVAEVFLTAWRRVADMPTEPLPWLLAIARKTLANQARGARRRVSLSTASPPSDPLSRMRRGPKGSMSILPPPSGGSRAAIVSCSASLRGSG